MTVHVLGLPSGMVRLTPADPSWPDLFRTERAHLQGCLDPLVARIEHVGSTAIPNLPAKPIIDLLIGRPSASELAPYVRAIISAGYRYRGENGLPGREYFLREQPGGVRTHHLHLVIEGGRYWQAHLAFRDYLTAVPARAAQYAALKQVLAARYANDREAYTEAKSDFVAETLRLAGCTPTTSPAPRSTHGR